MELVLKIVAIVLSFGMLGVAYAVSRTGSWLMPASLYSVAWFLFTVIPLVSLPTVPVNPLAIGYILLTCTALALPSLLQPMDLKTVKSTVAANEIFDTALLRAAFVVFAALSMIGLVGNALAQGVSITALLTDFYAVSNSLIADRYSGRTVATIMSQIANISSYTAVALGGLIFPGMKTAQGRYAVLASALLPALLVMLVFGAKGMIFLCIAMFYAGTLIRRLRQNDHRMVDKGTLSRGVLGVFILIPFVTISFISRGLYAGSGVAVDFYDALVRYYVSYTSAHVYAFSDWFTWYVGGDAAQFYGAEDPTGGFYTFMSIFRALGDERYVPPGVYAEYFQYGVYLQSNIYTMFRGLITDFTLLGSLAFMVVLGAIMHSSFVAMARNEFSTWGIALYISFTGFVYTSFIISLLIWNSTYGSFVATSLVLIANTQTQAAARLSGRRRQSLGEQS